MWSSFKWRIFFLSSLLFLSEPDFAQELDLNFMNLGAREGLSSNIVTDLLKDRHGYMWFATDDGLNKYDGSQVTIYRHNPKDSTTIASNNILDLYEDDRGNLWIGTASGLVFYNRKMDSFVNNFPGIQHTVTSVTSDLKGNIWMSGYGGTSILDPKTRKLIALQPKSFKDRATMSQATFRLFRDKKGGIWFGTNTGVHHFSPSANVLKHYQHSESDPASLAGNAVKAITQDSGGRIWVGTENGLSMLRADGSGFVNYRHRPGDPTSLGSDLVYALAVEQNGRIWVGTEEGLNILNPSNGKVIWVNQNRRNKYSIVGKSVRSILLDNQGIYWVSTFRGGVNKYDKNLPFFNLRQSNPSDPLGLSAPVVTSFAEAPGDNVYVGTDGGGLNLFDRKSGTFRQINLSNSDESDRLAILSMERVGSQIWIGTFLKGLFLLDIESSMVKRLTKKSGPAGLSGSDIFCIKKDSHGNVWLGTNGEGVDRYNATTKEFEHFNKHAKGSRHIQLNGYIRAIEEDLDGNIWIGSNGSGIAVYNPATESSQIYNAANSDLPDDNILSICAATNGLIWISTAGEGLSCFDPHKKRFVSYSESNGLANGVIYKVLQDRAGKIWVSTNKGLSCFDPMLKRYRNYSYYNGLQRNPFVLGAGLRLSDGTLFFGGTDGFNYFSPEKLQSNKNVPRIVLTDLKVSNQSVVPSEDSELKEHISVADEIHLDYKQNFSLSFVALNYTSPHENRYLYKLENFDKDWNKVGAVNSAIYTNLDPGTYIFHVKGVSEAGDWSTGVRSIKIYVHPPFWRTYFAYMLYILMAGCCLWYIRYRGIRKLKARFALEQERLEAERLHEFDQLKIKFLTNLSHEFRTPISLIVGPVEQLLQVETAPGKSEQLSMVRRNARRLLNLVNQLLDFRNMENRELRLNESEGDFIAFARDVAESFRDLAARRGINFEFRSSLKYYFYRFDQEKLERVLFNLLSNAFKFTTKGGEVVFTIEAAESLEGLRLTISDTGIGIEEDAQERIFDRFFQSEASSTILNQGSGIGLSITREFVRMHGGTIEVKSIPGQGSTFTIQLPPKQVEDRDYQGDSAEPAGDSMDDFSEPLSDIAGADTSVGHLPVVLLVEDNDDFRVYLRDNLKTFCKVVEASNGKEGWQKVLSSHPQLVVSDISMPQASGIDLCKKIKSDKRTSHIPVLLLTALTGEEDQLLGLETGANDYMTKPFNLDILNVKIRNLLALNERLKKTYSKQLKVVTPEVEIESNNEKLLSKVIQYIEDNLTNPQLSVEDLSKTVGMSRSSLYTKLLEVTGETPVEFIRSVKLDKAAVLLEKSDMNIAQVSYAAGFFTPTYFARAFKTKFNMLPSEYISLKRGDKTRVGQPE